MSKAPKVSKRGAIPPFFVMEVMWNEHELTETIPDAISMRCEIISFRFAS